MFINGIDINSLEGITFLGFDIQPCQIISYDEWITGALNPINTLPMEQRYAIIKLKVLVEGTEEETIERMSGLLAMSKKSTLNNLEYFFETKLNSASSKMINTRAYEYTILYDCSSKYKNEEIITLSKTLSQSVDVKGNTKTPCTYEIRPTTSIIDLEINGIKVHTVPINSVLIIDGEKCLITLNGANKFQDTELDEFPYLYSGVNTININNTNCEVKIKYKTRFV